ncbi:MAG: glutamine-hydrolyzing carbamoyl-phosphate synthase small subunit [Candidatus Nanopelagicaceae bacterium]
MSGARASGYLVLDDCTVFEGDAWGVTGETFGEIVFTTGMTGYQETLTDPSYFNQVVVMTAPHIGNTGMNREDEESRRIWVSGFVVRDPSPMVSNWRSTSTLEAEMKQYGVIGLSGVDTRAITLHIRERGAMRVGIFTDANLSREEMVVKVRNTAQMVGSYLADSVSIPMKERIPALGERKFRIAALDLGIKAATPRNFALRGVETDLLPVTTSFDEIKNGKYDGVFLSNGPGDPSAMNEVVATVRGILDEEIPLFGICFGHQILGRALGFDTYKLRFGHRGINQPVLNRIKDRVEITAHNHGFAVEAPTESEFSTVYGPGAVTHISLNDGVVEGLKLFNSPAFSVQYHPEAAGGPHDANYLFDEFVEMLGVYAKR